MRILTLLALLLVYVYVDIIKAEDEEAILFGEILHGIQDVDHESEIEANVMRPADGFGSSAASHHFRQTMHESEEKEEKKEQEKMEQLAEEVPIPLLEPLGPYGKNDDEDDAEDNYDSGGSVTDNLLPIDPNDPEEVEKGKQIAKTHLFSKILSINQGLHVTGVFEGDMRFLRNRNAAGDSDTWPKSKSGTMAGLVPIPYKIATRYNRTEVDVIKSAMALYKKHTCIRFVPRKSEISYIYITDAKGCWAYVGRTGYSAQTVSLGRPGCVSKGISAHEMMHVVGFQHEHSRSDRDRYVTVLEQNIQKSMKPNFAVHKNTKNLVVYDYNSVMHYSKNAFSKFQYLPAIQINPKRKPEPEIGQRERMSPYDIEEIKYLYNCAEGTYQRCGRDFVNSRGDTFSSPKHPNAYPAESHCSWKITVQKGLYISLTITDLNIENSTLCQKDAILIHDGPNAAAQQLKVICGTKTAATTVLSTGNNLFVMFTSDPNSKGTFTGFKASFKTTHSKGVPPTMPTVPTLPPIRNPVRSFSCDFDSGTCGMTQDTLDQIDWIRYKGATPSQGTGPKTDHTSGNGYYMYVESSLPSKLGDNAILRSPWMTRERASCISFSYHMLGAYMGTLRLYAFEKRKGSPYGHEVLLWERHGNQGNQWIAGSVTYRPKSEVVNVQFYWEAFVFFYQSDFGLDDVSVKNSACHSTTSGVSTTPSPSPTTKATTTTTTTKSTTVSTTTTEVIVTSPISAVACDFDSGFCGWTQEKRADDFDWIRQQDKTQSRNTGPRGDHTSEKGHFLFIEASSPRVEGDVARLVSPPLTTRPHCLRMWYHMYGSQMGRLVVRQITDDTETKLIEKSGNKGDQWLFLELDIVSPSIKTGGGFNRKAKLTAEASTYIAIDGVRGEGYPGDMAIDDIEITASGCVSQPIIPTTPTAHLRGVRCDFDTKNDLCGFSNGKGDEFDWTQNSGSTQSGSTGPTVDHTKGDDTGSYMYVEASSPRAVGHVATLVSPKLASGRYCVRFFVHMWGSGMGEVNVYTSEFVNGKMEARQRQWEMAGTQGDSWLEGEFEFESAVNIQYTQVEFQGVIGHTFTSDAALDDISITPGWCRNSAGGVAPTSSVKKPGTDVKKIAPTKKTTTTKKMATITTTTTIPATTTTTTTKKLTTKLTTTKPISTKPVTTRRPITRPRNSKKSTKKPAISKKPPTIQPSTTIPPTTRSRLIRPTRTKPVKTTLPTRTKPQGENALQFGKRRPTEKPSVSTSKKTNGRLKEFSCDFESEKYCGMLQMNEDKFNWIRHTGSTQTSGTGPLTDHTNSPKNTGYYLYIEGSDPREFRDNAIISTPPISTVPTERCVTFWYHMQGSGMGGLRVWSELSRNGIYKKYAIKPNKQLEFGVSGEKGNSWKMARFSLKKSSSNPSGALRLHFEGVRGKSYKSDLAIDDICITSSPCGVRSSCLANQALTRKASALFKKLIPSRKPQPATRTQPTKRLAKKLMGARVKTTTSKAGTTTTPAPAAKQSQDDLTIADGMPVIMPRCTFDVQAKKSGQPRRILTNQQPLVDGVLCGWEQDKRDDFDWSWGKGATPSTLTGPNGDHTSGKGHYLFIEASAPKAAGHTTVLKSAKMFPTSYCIELYYNMFGRTMGQLNVRAHQEMVDKPKMVSNLQMIKGQQGQAWKNLKVNYRPRGNVKNVQFLIEGEVGTDYMSDMAIDDISVTPGRCDSCSRPNRIFKDRLGQKKQFFTGCIHANLFYVKCCSLAKEKFVYQRISRCTPSALTPERLDRMCHSM